MKKICALIILVFAITGCAFVYGKGYGAADNAENDTSIKEFDVIKDNSMSRSGLGVYYHHVNDAFMSLKDSDIERYNPEKMETEVEYASVKRKLQYEYATIGDDLYIHQIFEGEDNERFIFQLAAVGQDAMLMYCTEDTAHGYNKIYPMAFDVQTGRYKDLLGEVKVDGSRLIEFNTIRDICIGESKIAATVGKGQTEDTVIIDKNTLKVTKLKDIMSVQTGDFYEFCGNSIIVYCGKQIWKYDFDSGRLVSLCENGERPDKESDGIIRDSSNIRYALVYQDNEMYVLDYEEETLKKVTGIDEGKLYSNYEMNQENNCAVISAFHDDGIEINIVNLDTGVSKKWEIKKGSAAYSKGFTGAVWGNGDNLILEYYREEPDGEDVYRVYGIE